MAAEAIGLGASVVSFVGFTGQILQGCLFIRNFLDDMEDAPAYIQTLRSELLNFQTSIQAFQSALGSENIIGEDARQVLEFSNKSIAELQELLATLDKKRNGTLLNFSSVIRKNRIMKHVENLKSARLQLLSAQSNMIMQVSRRC